MAKSRKPKSNKTSSKGNRTVNFSFISKTITGQDSNILSTMGALDKLFRDVSLLKIDSIYKKPLYREIIIGVKILRDLHVKLSDIGKMIEVDGKLREDSFRWNIKNQSEIFHFLQVADKLREFNSDMLEINEYLLKDVTGGISILLGEINKRVNDKVEGADALRDEMALIIKSFTGIEDGKDLEEALKSISDTAERESILYDQINSKLSQAMNNVVGTN